MGMCYSNKEIDEKSLNFDKNKNNYIIAEIEIKDDDVNKDIIIINSYDEFHRHWDFKQFKAEESNEEDILQCKIRINNEPIPFNYIHIFKNKGKYEIKYFFNNCLTKVNCLFYKCEKLTKIDLSNLNTDKLINMNAMFGECKSLTSINLTNINTKKVIDMHHMFYQCESLTNLDVSSFNTENVIYMNAMFSECKSLTDLNLSNFNTRNVNSMVSMFCGCKSLTKLDLSNFSTEKVGELNTDEMFDECDNLRVENVKTNDERLLFLLNNNFYI